jgi:hypothetical protein
MSSSSSWIFTVCLDSRTEHFCSIVVNDQQNASRSQWILLIYSKFTPTCFGKWLPSSGGRRCLGSYSSSVCIVGVYGLRSVQCGQLFHDNWPPLHRCCPPACESRENRRSNVCQHPEESVVKYIPSNTTVIYVSLRCKWQHVSALSSHHQAN